MLGYTELKPEAPYEIQENRPDPSWPAKGNVEFVKYSTKYRPELQPVLKNVSLSIKGGEKIGVSGLPHFNMMRRKLTMVSIISDLRPYGRRKVIYDVGAVAYHRANVWQDSCRWRRYYHTWAQRPTKRYLDHPGKLAASSFRNGYLTRFVVYSKIPSCSRLPSARISTQSAIPPIKRSGMRWSRVI